MIGDFLHDYGSPIVAGLALILGVVNFIRQVRSDPKPDVRAVYEWDDEEDQWRSGSGPDPWEGLYIKVTNRGPGQANDVTVTVQAKNGETLKRELGTLATDQSGQASFNLADDAARNGRATIAWRHKGKRPTISLDY